MKKFICLILGHKLDIKKCPYSNASKQYCLRCNPKSQNKMSFN